MPKAKPSGIGRVLNGGQPLACGHCKGETDGAGGELKGIDVSPQGVSCERMNRYIPIQLQRLLSNAKR